MTGKLVPALVAATALVFPAAASAQRRHPHRFQRPIAGRQRQQPRPPDVGAGRRAVPPGRAGELRRRHQDARQPARRPATSATASSTTSPRTCSRSATSRSGGSCGASSWTTRSACARRSEARARTSRSTCAIRWRSSRTTSARSSSRARPRRPAPVPGGRVRQHINTVSSYIDGSSVYGDYADRLEWLRTGPVDGRMINNGAKLLLGDEPDAAATRRAAATRQPLRRWRSRAG